MMTASIIWLRCLRVMMTKELLQLFRDKVLLLFTLYAFTVDIYLAGSGVAMSLNRAALLIHDADRSALSRELIYRFQEPYFSFSGQIEHSAEGLARLDRGDAMLVLDIPPQFQRTLLRGQSAAVQMQVDTTNSVLGSLAASYAAQIVGQFALETALARSGLSADSLQAAPVLIDDHRVWFNPNQSDPWFMSISETLTIITVFAIMLPAAAMVREKERGTVEQLLVSPLTPLQIMLPKVLAMTLVIVAMTGVSLALVLSGIFHVPLRGSLLLFFAVTALYVFTTAGLGLLIATLTRNMAQAGMLLVMVLAPMLFLSGIWTPPEAMPLWMRLLTLISPLHYFIDAGYGILLKGAGIALLWPSLLGIIGLGGAIFGIALLRFRRQFR